MLDSHLVYKYFLFNILLWSLLSNSNGNIKIKVGLIKLYINNTYLSNTFAARTDIRFNDYVTMVKMKSINYLFTNTQLKTYEVGYKI